MNRSGPASHSIFSAGNMKRSTSRINSGVPLTRLPADGLEIPTQYSS